MAEQHAYGLGPAAGPTVLREFFKKRPDPVIPEKPEGTMTIVSVFPRTAFNKVHQFGRYEIAPCPPCETHGKAPCAKCGNYAKLVVGAAIEAIDDPLGTDGSGRRLQWLTPAQVARSLVVDNCIDRGVFVCNSDEPTPEELAEARATFKAWAETAVQSADAIWNVTGKHHAIDPLARDAAKFLGLKRDWLSETQDLVDCEACGERAKKGAVLCKCGNPFNWQKAADMGLLTEKQETYGRKGGMIRSEEPEEEPAAVVEPSEPPTEKKPKTRHIYGQ
jgi:hypothetical protein